GRGRLSASGAGAGFRLRANLFVAVDDNPVGGLEEGQRATGRFATRLHDLYCLRPRSGHQVSLLVREVGQALSDGGTRVEFEAPGRVRLETRDTSSFRRENHLDTIAAKVALRSTQLRLGGDRP